MTERCAWRIAVDVAAMGKEEVDYPATRLPDCVNLFKIRSLAEFFVDDEISKGIHEGVAEHD